MSHVSSRRRLRGSARMLAAPLAVTAALGAGTLALASPALAVSSPIPRVRTEVLRADAALKVVVSAAADGTVSVPLGNIGVELGAAAKLSASLSLHADTQATIQAAAGALGLLAQEQAKVEASLTADLSAISAAEQTAVADLGVQIAQDREATISVLVHLDATAKVDAHAAVHAISTELGALANVDASVLGDVKSLLGAINPSADVCSLTGAIAQLASTETVDVQGDVSAVGTVVSLLGAGAGAELTRLADLSASLKLEINAQVHADAGCQTPTSGTPSTSVTGSVLGSVLGTLTGAIAGGATGS